MFDSSIRNYYLKLAAYYELHALLARARYAFWESQKNTFDEINTSTGNLMTQGSGFREAARQGMESITKSFQDGVYCIDLNAPWRSALSSENSKRMEQLKAQFLKEDEDGKTEYDWKKIEKWLKQDAEEVSDLEYLAFIDLMSGMSNEELQNLFSAAQINPYCVSKVLKEAAGKYQILAQLEAELTLFNEHSRFEYDETEIVNSLSKALFIYQIVANIESGGGESCAVVITTQEGRGGKITYIADLVYEIKTFCSPENPDMPYVQTRKIKVNPWQSEAVAEKDLEDCVVTTLTSLDPYIGMEVGEAIGMEVLGLIIDKYAAALTYPLTAACLLTDIEENYKQSIAVNGAIQIVGTSQMIDALGITAGVISVSGSNINEAILFCPKYAPEDLMVRVETYNVANPENTIEYEELKNAIANNGEALEKYLDWYYEDAGDDKIEEYWGELEVILREFCEKNPGAINVGVRDVDLVQLRELISKKNDSSYEINDEVMKGEK